MTIIRGPGLDEDEVLHCIFNICRLNKRMRDWRDRPNLLSEALFSSSRRPAPSKYVSPSLDRTPLMF